MQKDKPVYSWCGKCGKKISLTHTNELKRGFHNRCQTGSQYAIVSRVKIDLPTGTTPLKFSLKEV